MSKVLLLGMCPLPIEEADILNAPGLRTWQFTKSLSEDGHRICLVCSRTSGAYNESKLKNIEKRTVDKGTTYYSLAQEKFLDLRCLQGIHDRFKPDCIVSASSFLPSYLAVRIKTDVPIWIDQSGDLTAEAQMRAFTEKDNSYLYDFWKIDREVLEKGDIFSAISTHQRYALIGKLGTKGRLNKETVGYEFVHVIPNGVDCTGNGAVKPERNDKIIRDKYVKKDDFVILWSGSYNTWTDIDVLFSALEKAMASNKKVKFVSTGGAVATHNEITYPHFLERINKSRFKDRFIILGWIPSRDLAAVYRESDLGINIDKPCYEAQLGCRNRILWWMKEGLPVLTTKFCDLTQCIEERKLGFIFPPENINALSKAILELSSKKRLIAEYGKRAKDFVRKELTYEKTTRTLQSWVKNPKHSPDRLNNLKTMNSTDNSERYTRNIEMGYIDNLKWRIGSLQSQIENFQGKDGELKRLYKELENLNVALANQVSEISNRDNRINELLLGSANLTNHCKNLEQHAKNLEEERKSLKEHIGGLNNEIVRLNNELGNCAKEISIRGEKMHQFDVEVNKLSVAQNYTGRIDTELSEAKASNKELHQEITSLNNRLNNQLGEISIRESRIHQLETEVNNLSTNLDRHRESIEREKENLKNHIEGLNNEIARLNGVITNQVSEISNRDNRINELLLESANLTNHYKNLEQHAKNLEEERKSLKERIGGLNNEIIRLNNELGNCAKEISIRGEKMHQLEMEVNSLNNECRSANKQMDEIKAEKAELKLDKLGLSTQVGILVAQIDELQLEFTQARAELENLIHERDTQITSLDAQYNALCAESDTLRTKLDLIYATRAYKFYRLITKLKKRPKDNWLCGFYK